MGKKLKIRKEYMDSIGPFLQRAWSGETFQHGDRTITITPRPHSEPRPMILMGGSSKPAARRAARDADFFIPAGPEIFEYYREELQKLGKPDPGPMPAAPSTVTFVAENPDAYWEQIAPHVQHETNIYPNAQHAFFNDTRAAYHPEAAVDAWEKMTRLFRETLT